MFFWVILGSLISVLAWGKFGEIAKSPDDYVVPVYEAMISSLAQQNKMAAEYASKKMVKYGSLYQEYSDSGSARDLKIGTDRPTTTYDSGVMFTIGSDGKIAGNTELGKGGAYYLNAYQYLKMADGFTSAYYCLNNRGTRVTKTFDRGLCRLNLTSATNVNVSSFVMTYGRIPYRYTTKSMHYLFQAIDKIEQGSKMIGYLKRVQRNVDDQGNVTYTDTKDAQADDDNTLYRIYAKGLGNSEAFYIPKAVITEIKNAEGVEKLNGYIAAIEILRFGSGCAFKSEGC